VNSSSHDFRRFWFGQAVSQFGTYIGSAALALTAILVLQASPSELGILAAAAALPALLVALPAGAWIDTIRRRPLLIMVDLGRAAVLLAIPILYWYGILAESVGIRLTLGVAVVGIILSAGWVVLLRGRGVPEHRL
jgi:MFS family permease